MSRYAEIYPALALPRGLDYFDYSLTNDAQVSPGDIVQVNFRGRKSFGIVKKIKHSTQVPQKALQPVQNIFHTGAFTPAQLKLIHWIADEYHSSIGLVLRSAFVQPTQKDLERERTHRGRKASMKTDTQVRFLQYTYPASHMQYLRKALEEQKRNSSSLLILFPDLASLENAYQQLDPKNQKQYLIVHGSLSRASHWALREKIRQGNCVVLGTGSALYEPYPDLSEIIITDAVSEQYKQSDRQPHLQIVRVAHEAAKIYQAKLSYTGRAPSVELLALIKASKGAWLRTKAKQEDSEIQLSSLKNESREGPGGILCVSAAEALRQALSNGQRVLIYRNRRGTFHGLNCRDCGWTPSCPSCQSQLRVKEQILNCSYCAHQQAIATTCPECRGVRLRPSSYGIEGSAQALQTLFPQARIIHIDKEQEVDATALTNADILIGTEKLFRIPLPVCHLALVLSLEAELARPEWNSTENVYQRLMTLRFLQPTLRRLIIQTYEPEQLLLQYLSPNTIQLFLKREQEARNRFLFPPNIRLLKLSREIKDAAEAKRLGARTIEALKKDDTAGVLLEVLPPKLLGSLKSSQKLLEILLKLKPQTSQTQRKTMLGILDAEWKIDLDPLP